MCDRVTAVTLKETELRVLLLQLSWAVESGATEDSIIDVHHFTDKW